MNRRILAVFAHPDDESFGTGGTLARYAKQGAEVVLVCATRGEVGEIADDALATPETLGKVREDELRCAAASLGISELIFLNYRDSGMAGTPENEVPEAFINTPAEVVVQQLVEIIRSFKPQIVITFEPNGGYGHPDHIAIHKHTVTAFHAAAEAQQYPNSGSIWRAERLFFTALPKSFFREIRSNMISLGMDTGEMDQFEAAVEHWPDEAIHLTIDVGGWVEAKWSALYCHRTQFGPDNLFRRLPEPMMKKLMSKEHFALAWPEPEAELKILGLFDGEYQSD